MAQQTTPTEDKEWQPQVKELADQLAALREDFKAATAGQVTPEQVIALETNLSELRESLTALQGTAPDKAALSALETKLAAMGESLTEVRASLPPKKPAGEGAPSGASPKSQRNWL